MVFTCPPAVCPTFLRIFFSIFRVRGVLVKVFPSVYHSGSKRSESRAGRAANKYIFNNLLLALESQGAAP